MTDRYYWLMDGRASYDIDAASVLETCDTYRECVQNIHDYGSDTCIVLVEEDGQALLWCLLDGEPPHDEPLA